MSIDSKPEPQASLDPDRVKGAGTSEFRSDAAQADESLARPEELLDLYQEIESIHRIGTLLAAELDLDRLIQKITDEATQIIHAGFGAFFYNALDERGETYVLYTLSGAPREAFASFPMPRNTKIFEPTFRNTGTLLSDDITRDPRYGQNAPYKGMPEGHLPVRSYLAVSVVSRKGEVLGGLFFGHPEPGRFTLHHQRLIEGIAPQAAIAIENARLFQDLQRREQEVLEREKIALLTAEIGSAATAEVELPGLLKACTEAIARLPALSWAGIWILRGQAIRHYASAGASSAALVEDIGLLSELMQSGKSFHSAVDDERPPAWADAPGYLAAFPLMVEGRPMGLLAISALAAPNPRMLEALASEARVIALGIKQRRTTAKLNTQLALLKAVTDHITAGLLMTDKEGHATFVNPAAATLLGYQPEALIGRSMHEAIHHSRPDGSEFPREACPLEQALPEQAAVKGYEDAFIAKDGSFIPVRCSAVPILERGVPMGTVVEVQDLRAERAATDSLRQANQLLAREKTRQDELIRAMRSTHRTASRILAEGSRSDKGQAVIELLSRDFKASVAGIWLFEDHRRLLRLAQGHGLDPRAASDPELSAPGIEPLIEVAMNPYKIGWVARYKMPFVSQISHEDIQFDQRWVKRLGIRSALIYPLMGRSELHGVLAAFLTEEIPMGLSEVAGTLAAIYASSLDLSEGGKTAT